MRRALTIIVSGTDPDRLRSAFGVAAAEAALGGRVRLFFDAGAVSLLRVLPAALEEMLEAAIDLAVEVSVCQTGLAEQGITLDPRFNPGGLVTLMADSAEDRLLLA